MLTLVLRRALVQRRLLGSVVVLVVTACTLVGTCTLVLGQTQERAFHVAVEQTPPDDVSVTAFVVDLASGDVEDVGDEAARTVDDVLAPMRPRLETTITTRLRDLDGGRATGGDELGYLMATDALPGRADLVAGRWPAADAAATGPTEAVVPDATARLLGLEPGDEVTLGREAGLGGADEPVALVVVGTFRPRGGVEWERDPLAGTGFSAAFSDGLPAAPTYGPFVVPEAALVASGSSVNALRVTAHPTLALAGDASLRAAASSLSDAEGMLAGTLDDRVRLARLDSALPRTLDQLHAQQASTRSTVVVVLLLAMALSLAAALFAGRLVAAAREDERDLLVAMGLGRRQDLGTAAAEALLLSVVATVVAVPIAALVHSRLTHLTGLEAAGLQQGPVVTWQLVASELGAAVLLTGALVLATVGRRTDVPSRASSPVVRHGLDLVLLVAAALAWWQLRERPAAAGSDDVVLTVAPVLLLAALTVVGVRLVPPLLAAAARTAVRSRSLVVPLATQQAARRPHTGTAMVLISAAVAAAVLGIATSTTWSRSQADQAALRVGADLTLALPAPAGLREAAAVRAALGASPPLASPVSHRPLVLGRYVGEPGSRPVLVAVDTREADALLRGRSAPGRSWADIVARLSPSAPTSGIPLPDAGAGVELRGGSPAGSALVAVPTVVLEDGTGFRASVTGSAVPLDGEPHPIRWLDPLGAGLRVVGLRLEVDGSSGGGPGGKETVRVTMSVPSDGGGTSPGPSQWEVQALSENSPVSDSQVSVRSTAAGTDLTTTLGLDLLYIDYTGADVMATSFPAVTEVPVVVSQDLVDAVGAGVGDELSAFVGDTALLLVVRAVVPTVPSEPGQVAVLADADTLSRALVTTGRLDPVVDAWWVARPTAQVATDLRAAGLGRVTTRQEVATDLARGPLRVAVPPTLLSLVALAVAMLLAGVVLVLRADRSTREAEVVRLRAIGLPRRGARRLQVVEHLLLVTPLVLAGAAVGAVATVLVAPLLVRSDVGAAPVPPAVVAWPWTPELLLVGGLLVVAAVLTAAHDASLVRRTDTRPVTGGAR